MHTSLLDNWTADDFGAIEKGVLLARHRLAETGLFTDESLANIIDRHPDEHLTISTMGRDSNTFEWREGDRNGVPGDVLVHLVKQGHLWINCRQVMRHHPELCRMVHAIFDELEANAPGFRAAERSANLLISSPDALVHYHIDTPLNMLWHLRGRKRVWVYPAFDFRFVPQHVVEQVCAGDLSEDVPYDARFDRYALVFDVEPGQLLAWPQMAPHRVTNLEGLNVSLSTEHKNATIKRRVNVHIANQLLRRKLGRWHHSTGVDGPAAHLKQTTARIHRKLTRLFGKAKRPHTYPKSFRVDPTAPCGYTLVNLPDEQLAAPFLTDKRPAIAS